MKNACLVQKVIPNHLFRAQHDRSVISFAWLIDAEYANPRYVLFFQKFDVGHLGRLTIYFKIFLSEELSLACIETEIYEGFAVHFHRSG